MDRTLVPNWELVEKEEMKDLDEWVIADWMGDRWMNGWMHGCLNDRWMGVWRWMDHG